MEYNNTYIVYKIICLDTNEIYIGSTSNFRYKERMRLHKSNKNTCCSKNIIQRQNYKIEIIEENIEGYTDKLWRERYFIENTPNCINIKKKPIISRIEEKERNKLYYQKSKSI
jgi:hypothetical protein